ncbi:uncharacterized protein THITE_2121499 [Thermothielavioides terrestris NRRL 8126]|jgi:hypothetical protein|uniref:Uncharacterized protein n=1 Tax=Thermothielavioides terrestris (strain ATCC 38088 / NRRL 8126) TaxID=578455 RepID=G2REZ5_THETT|nr:uncharacterized protein THITE_2121499 [Thermothielavioides terrestris NRRL 8126]AEO70278.1 hypothetical protein THITE_2121499 [Thermothielavioides terrestris NRRL 8126]
MFHSTSAVCLTGNAQSEGLGNLETPSDFHGSRGWMDHTKPNIIRELPGALGLICATCAILARFDS